VAKPDCIEEPSVTTATVTMSRSLRALGGSMALRRGVVLVVEAQSIFCDSIIEREGRWVRGKKKMGPPATLRVPVDY